MPWRRSLPGSTPMPHSASRSFNACSFGACAVSCKAACATLGPFPIALPQDFPAIAHNVTCKRCRKAATRDLAIQ